MELDPIAWRLRAAWAQLHGPSASYHRTAILAYIDRLLDDHLAATHRSALEDEIEPCPRLG